MKLGIYGGTFDPVHLGHLLAARAAVEELGLDRLFFVPAARSPFKPGAAPAAADLRLRLLRLALAGTRRLDLDTQELERGGVSPAILTLRQFQRKHPGAELFFLIGADHVAALGTWQEAAELARLAVFVAVPRPGTAPAEFSAPFQGRTLRGTPFGVSSAEIRERVRAGLPVDHLAPPAVVEAIAAEGLYR